MSTPDSDTRLISSGADSASNDLAAAVDAWRQNPFARQPVLVPASMAVRLAAASVDIALVTPLGALFAFLTVTCMDSGLRLFDKFSVRDQELAGWIFLTAATALALAYSGLEVFNYRTIAMRTFDLSLAPTKRSGLLLRWALKSWPLVLLFA